MLEAGAQSAGNGDELVFGIRCRTIDPRTATLEL
jgi:hypothetical protein